VLSWHMQFLDACLHQNYYDLREVNKEQLRVTGLIDRRTPVPLIYIRRMSEDSIRLSTSIDESIQPASRSMGCYNMVPSWHTTYYRHRAKRRPSTTSSSSNLTLFTTHHLLVIILLQLLSITVTNAMIYLEEPAQALIYDSLPDPPDRHTISQVFLSNLTEGGLDNVRFRVGTPFHYLRAYSSSDSNKDEEEDQLAVAPPLLSDEVLGGNSTSYANATSSAVDDINTTTITSGNIINDTNTDNNTINETISSSSTNNTANSTVFERRTRSERGFVPTYEKPSSSSSQSLSPPSDEEPTIEISGEYTDIIHHNPQSINNNNNGGDIIIKDNHGNSITITELLGFFNDSKLVFDEVKEDEEQYVLYDSRQARFGTDLGPKGNAAFVNIMLPPRWGEDLDNKDVVDDGMGDVGGQQGGGISESNSEIVDTNATTADVDSVVLNDQPIRGLQDDLDELLGLVDDESFDNNSTGMEGESGEGASNETETFITETNHTEEITLFDDEIATINVVNTSTSLNDATATDQVEEFNGEFDTHISSYFCLDDFISWRSKRSSSINNDTAIPASSSSTILSIDNLNVANSTRGIALMVQRGRCSFQNKAELAMVFNDLLASAGKSNRIENIIVYNNGTIDKSNNGTNGEEKLVEMLLVPKRNGTLFESIKPINVGMLYITTGSGRDLMHRMLEQQNKLGRSPYMDISSILPARDSSSSGWSRSLLINESTQNDGQHDGSVVQEDAPIHDEAIANGWFFPATLTRFCLSCGEQTDYGFYPFALVGDRPGQNPRPTNWPPTFSDDYYTPRRWVEMIRRLMIAILVLLLVGPVVLATHRWHHVGGTIRWQTDENGRRRLRIISPNLELFVNGVHDAVETNGTKLDRAQVFALPEIVYNPSSSDSRRDVSENDATESPLMANESDLADGVSSDSFRENDDCRIDSKPAVGGTIEDSTPSLPAPISPSGSEASEMYESSTCCPICIEEFEAGEILRVLPRCKHLFHTECILPWLTKRQGCCPQCRTPVLPDEYQQRSRSPRASPLRRSSGISSTRRERDGQQTEESDTSLSGTRLFTGIADDLGTHSPAEELPQRNQGSIFVPHAAEVNESHLSHAESVRESSHELMEQGIAASNEIPLDNSDDTSEAANENTEPIGQRLANSEVPSIDNHVSGNVGITAVISSDDIESNNSALAPVEDEENTQNNILDPPQISSASAVFLNSLTPNVAEEESNSGMNQRGAKDKDN
jgi:hypothetical protein